MGTAAARKQPGNVTGEALFAAIGRFLVDNRLEPSPLHYAFAHRVVSHPDGHLAKAVMALTDGGVRLTASDIETLGGPASPDEAGSVHRASVMVSQAEVQIRDFSGLIDRVRAETNGFGRDLAASARRLDQIDAPELVRLTATMLARVQQAETKLNRANDEAEALREQVEAARGEARNDPLTGLPNRRALTEDYAARIASGAPFCMAVCDIDHFKRINDGFGHAIGDRVLTAIANALAEHSAPAFVARYGAEEFAALFAGNDVAAAAQRLDEVRAIVAAKHYKVRQDDTPLGSVTFSGGVVAVVAGAAFETTVAQADALLYAAKDAGRNCIRH